MTYKQARRKALVVYKKALRAVEKGDWRRAERLTTPHECAFCQVRDAHGCGYNCSECPARNICGRRLPYLNAGDVRMGFRTEANGLRHFRLTIKQLEALNV